MGNFDMFARDKKFDIFISIHYFIYFSKIWNFEKVRIFIYFYFDLQLLNDDL